MDYHFVDVATFQQKIERGEFVEWAEVHGHFYGSPQSTVDEARAGKSVAIFDIDVQGGQAIKRKHPDAVTHLRAAALHRGAGAAAAGPSDGLGRDHPPTDAGCPLGDGARDRLVRLHRGE